MREDVKKVGSKILNSMTTAGKAVGNYGIACAKNYLKKQEEQNRAIAIQNELVERAKFQEELRLELSTLMADIFDGLNGYSLDSLCASHMRNMGMKGNNIFIYGIPKTNINAKLNKPVTRHLQGLILSSFKTEVRNVMNYYGIYSSTFYPILAMRASNIIKLHDTGVEYVMEIELN